MSRPHFRAGAAWGLVALLAACRPGGQPARPAEAVATAAAPVQPAAMVVDSEAVRLLKASLDHLSGLQRFSARTRIFTEDLLDTGHRVDYESYGQMTIQRPDKLRGERVGVGYHQAIYYDGTTVTLYDAAHQVYASKPAPSSLPTMFEMAYDSLGLSVPMSDLVWPDDFALMMDGVTMARVLDKEDIEGVTCYHLVFSRPDVDFQIWIPARGAPLPRKYIVTDTSTPALLSIVTTITEWKVDPRVAANAFTFAPPAGVTQVTFLTPEFDH
jgi:hypothetical protein